MQTTTTSTGGEKPTTTTTNSFAGIMAYDVYQELSKNAGQGVSYSIVGWVDVPSSTSLKVYASLSGSTSLEFVGSNEETTDDVPVTASTTILTPI